MKGQQPSFGVPGVSQRKHFIYPYLKVASPLTQDITRFPESAMLTADRTQLPLQHVAGKLRQTDGAVSLSLRLRDNNIAEGLKPTLTLSSKDRPSSSSALPLLSGLY